MYILEYPFGKNANFNKAGIWNMRNDCAEQVFDKTEQNKHNKTN